MDEKTAAEILARGDAKVRAMGSGSWSWTALVEELCGALAWALQHIALHRTFTDGPVPATLEQAEWGGRRQGIGSAMWHACCPTCQGLEEETAELPGSPAGHAPGCELAEQLARLGGRS